MSEARKFLKRVQHIEYDIRSRQTELEKLQSLLSISVKYKDVNVQTSSTNNAEQTMAKIIDAQRLVDEKIDELIEHKMRVSHMLDKMQDRLLCAILRDRYLNQKRWEDISTETGQTVRNLHYLHGQALREFDKVFH